MTQLHVKICASKKDGSKQIESVAKELIKKYSDNDLTQLLIHIEKLKT